MPPPHAIKEIGQSATDSFIAGLSGNATTASGTAGGAASGRENKSAPASVPAGTFAALVKNGTIKQGTECKGVMGFTNQTDLERAILKFTAIETDTFACWVAGEIRSDDEAGVRCLFKGTVDGRNFEILRRQMRSD